MPTEPSATKRSADSTTHVSGIDGLRGLSALAVLCFHLVAYAEVGELPWKLTPLSQVGLHGVDVFIVLSGFCLALPLTRPATTLDAGQFFGRRLWRILPAYWTAVLVATTLVTLGFRWPWEAPNPSPWGVIINLLALQTVFAPAFGVVNSSLWSVSLELTLYAVFPLVVIGWRRWGAGIVTLAAMALCVAWFQLPSTLTGDGILSGLAGDEHALPARLVQFAAGVWTADILSRHRPPWRMAATAAVVCSLAATVATTVGVPRAVNVAVWALAGAALVCAFAVAPRTRLLAALDAFGRRSFSFYLLHQPAILVAIGAVRLVTSNTYVVLAASGLLGLALAVIAAELLYRGIELPSHRRGRHAFPKPVRQG